MKALKKNFVLAACILCFWVTSAQADLLNIGGSFTYPLYMLHGTEHLTEGGGSVDPSFLNGTQLAYLYCVDPWTVVYASTTYNNTVVTTNGTISGAPVNAAGQIAWLLSQYGTGGQGESAYALQAAIWHLVDPSLAIDASRSTANEVSLYNSYLTSLGSHTGDVSSFIWLSPGISGSSTKYQGLVGNGTAPQVGEGSPTPIPAAVWLFGSGLIGLIGLRRKFPR